MGSCTPHNQDANWTARFECKTCGWKWFAVGRTPERCFAQFDHTCIGPTFHAPAQFSVPGSSPNA